MEYHHKGGETHEMSLLRLPREQGGGFPSCGRGKDGSRQSFDRSKVLRGIQRSCEKRPVSVAEMERMVTEIEQELQNSLEREISTGTIGEKVMEKLKKADEVAYVRFASVYRQFKDINTFMSELNKLLSEK